MTGHIVETVVEYVVLIAEVYGILHVTGHIVETVVEYVVLIVEVYDILLITLFVWVSLYVLAVVD